MGLVVYLLVPSKRLLPLALGPLPFLAGVGVCVSVACDVSVHNGRASVHMFSAEAGDEWTHRHPLAAGGRVEIININGPITISAGAPGSVDVHATITAKALTESGAREILSKGTVQETAEPAHVRVETMAPRVVHGSYEVRYDVQVPADTQMEVSITNGPLKAGGLSGKLKATAVNGRVALTGMSGAIDGVVANGSLEVSMARVTAEVRLEMTNGRLSLDLPATSKAQLSARVVNGSLEISGLPIEAPTGRRIRNLEAALNGGGPSIDLRATNGRLTIAGK